MGRGSSVIGVPLQNLGKFVYPKFVSDETIKGPCYLVSVPGKVKDPSQGVNV